jgi:hypothetical protein
MRLLVSPYVSWKSIVGAKFVTLWRRRARKPDILAARGDGDNGLEQRLKDDRKLYSRYTSGYWAARLNIKRFFYSLGISVVFLVASASGAES